MNYNYFHTTKKQGHIHQVNQNTVWASRIIDKGCKGLLKICPILGSYSEYTKYWENLVQKFWEENYKSSVEKTKKRVAKLQDIPANGVVDIHTSFYGSWSSYGWTAN